jgi:hypothetical protein
VMDNGVYFLIRTGQNRVSQFRYRQDGSTSPGRGRILRIQRIPGPQMDLVLPGNSGKQRVGSGGWPQVNYLCVRDLRPFEGVSFLS